MKKKSIVWLIVLAAVFALTLAACPDTSGGGGGGGGPPPPPPTYIVTGSGEAFTTTKGGVTVGTAGQPIQDVINAIRTHAAGANCVIQFGDGSAVLDAGTFTDTPAVTLQNTTGETWGMVTLTGKITSNVSSSGGSDSFTTISIADPVSVTSSADIANSNTGIFAKAVRFNSAGALTITGGTLSNPAGYTVFNASTGTVTISGGTIKSTTSGWAVYNASTGTITISGGTVSSTSSVAVYISGSGKVTVSGTANITSASTSATNGTINLSSYNSSATATDVLLEMTGGTVTNTSTTTGNAIYHGNKGKINITGGTVSKAGSGGNAIYNNSTGVVTIGPGATIEGNNYGVTP